MAFPYTEKTTDLTLEPLPLPLLQPLASGGRTAKKRRGEMAGIAFHYDDTV